MDEQEQQNVVNDEQQDINQVEPTSVSSPPSHKKLIIGIVAVFVLVVAGIAGAYFLLKSETQSEDEIQLVAPINVEESGNFQEDFKPPEQTREQARKGQINQYFFEVLGPAVWKSLSSGESTEYEFVIKNIGEIADSYDITATSTKKWGNFGTLPQTINLNPNEEHVFSVQVAVPKDAEEGTSDRLTVKATSQGNYIQKRSASVSTYAKINDTSQWMTFRSEKMGYEVKYPPEPELEIIDHENITFFYKKSFYDSLEDGDFIDVAPEIEIKFISQAKAEEIDEKNILIGEKNEFQDADKSVIVYRFTKYGWWDISEVVIFSNKNSKIIYLRVRAELPRAEIVEPMLNTFKFIE